MSEPTFPTQHSADDSAAAPFDVFLSHNSKDRHAVERIAEKLKRAKLEPWLDTWCLTPGGDSPAELAAGLQASLACAVFIGPHGVGDWEDLEYKSVLARAVKDRTFRLFPVLLPGLPEPFDPNTLPLFLSMRTWVDLRKGHEDTRAFQSLINAIKGLPLGPERAIEPRNDICPYRGLQTFDEAHAEFFFGRDGDIQRLVEKLKNTRFIAVLGPSGSGKSSLVRAGLIPAIRKGQLPGSEAWPIQVFTPTAHPLTQLAANLLRLYPQNSMKKTLDEMANDEHALHQAVALAMADRKSDERAVLVVDQFEEIFTLCRDERERAQFLANLLYAGFVPGGRTVVLLTLRADFYQKCAASPLLSARLAEQQFLVSPMSLGNLQQTIEEPAWLVGLEFEAGLVATVLKDIENQPGALPLLEHALLELWERRRGGMLTLEGYRESGGVEGAIAKRADTIFKSFTPEQQAIVRRVMLRLTQPGEGAEDTRRRAALRELVTRADESAVIEEVVQEMADARLLMTTSDGLSGERVVDVSHEALIRGWPLLRRWLDEDRSGLLVHRRLTEAAEEWDKQGRDESYLYEGLRLQYAKEWAAPHLGDFNTLELAFLFESILTEETSLQEWLPRYGDVGQIIELAIQYLRSGEERRRRKGLSVLRWLPAAPLAEETNALLLKVILDDESVAVRNQAVEVLVERGQLKWLAERLHLQPLSPAQKKHFIRALGYARNRPRSGAALSRLLKGADKRRVWRAAVFQLVSQYRTQFAIIFSLSYLTSLIALQLISRVSFIVERLLRRIGVADYDASLPYNTDLLVITVVLGFYALLRARLDGAALTARACLKFGALAALSAESIFIVGRLVEELIATAIDHTPLFTAISNPFISLVDGIMAMSIVMLFIRTAPEAKGRGGRVLWYAMLASAGAVLCRSLVSPLLRADIAALAIDPREALTGAHMWLLGVAITFGSLLGFKIGLRLTLGEAYAISQLPTQDLDAAPVETGFKKL